MIQARLVYFVRKIIIQAEDLIIKKIPFSIQRITQMECLQSSVQCFVNHYFSSCPFYFGHCNISLSSMYGFLLPLAVFNLLLYFNVNYFPLYNIMVFQVLRCSNRLYLQLFVGGFMSLPPVVCRRVHVLFTLFVFVSIVMSSTYCVVLLFCFSSYFVIYVASFSRLSIFD